MKELCPKCKPGGFCQFEAEASKIARLANDGRVDDSSALESIKNMRVYARETRLCPRINKVNPKIEGL